MASLHEMTVGQDIEFKRILSKEGFTCELAESVLKDPSLATIMVEALDAEIERRNAPSLQSFTLKVDRSKSLAKLIELGNYDWVNENITQEHFAIEMGEGTEEVEVILVCFREVVTTDEAKSRIAKLDLEPSGIQELLTLGAAEPELQRQFPIAALGSSWRDPRGYLHSPYLCEYDDERSLSLHWCRHEDRWSGHDRFLARRK